MGYPALATLAAMVPSAHADSPVTGVLSPAVAPIHPFLFWGMHSAGWIGFVAFSTLASWMVGADWSGLRPSLAAGVVGFVLTASFRYALRSLWDGSPWRLGLALAACWSLGSLALGLTYSTVNAAQIDKAGFMPDAWLHAGIVLSRSFVVLSWLGLYVGIRYHLQMREQSRRMIAAAAMAHEAQLKMLRFQINPHFLFNTLNAISTLVLDGDNAGAASMVQRLAAFFRHSLETEPAHRLRLADEIAATRLYLQIEQVRFGERLTLRIAVAPDCEDALVPGMILQPLLENAIKHGVARRPGPSLVEIHAERDQEHLLLRVANSGRGFDADDLSVDDRTANGRIFEDSLTGDRDSERFTESISASPGLGVGLHNTRTRLAALYGTDATLHFGVHPYGGAEVEIRLPLELVPAAQEIVRDR
jgi:two-component system LytT family sensor kinase